MREYRTRQRYLKSHWPVRDDDQKELRALIDDLGSAIAKRRFCDIRYHSAWNKTTKDHRIRPLKLLWHKSALYLLALIDSKADITTFSVQRIQTIDVSDDSFPEPRVDIEEHTRKAFGVWVSDDVEDVEILFSEAIAWRIEERVFHPDEKKERLEDGRLRYSLLTSAQWEIIPWVLSFGANAELVGPSSVITSKAASCDRLKSGQLGTRLLST